MFLNISVRKEKMRPSLFADDMIMYIENAFKKYKTLLELVNLARSHDTGSIYKSIVFLHSSIEQSNKEIHRAILFILASKNVFRNKCIDDI